MEKDDKASSEKTAEQGQGSGAGPESWKELLESTHGIWRGVDGLQYQRDIRGEWEERP